MVRPGTRSMASSPVVLSSLTTSRQYTSGPSHSEGQRLEHRLRLVLGLRELARRIGVRHDPRACLYHHSILEDQGRADRDRRVQVHGAPADVPHRAGVGPAAPRLEPVGAWHGAALGSPGPRPAPRGRVPAMGRTVTSPPSARTSTSGELPTSAKSSNWRWNRYGAGLRARR